MKKFIALILALTLIACAAPAALATAVDTPTTRVYNPNIASPRALKAPSEDDVTSLPYNAILKNMSIGSHTYTKFCFTPSSSTLKISGSLTPSVDAKSNVYRIMAEIYKVDGTYVDAGFSRSYSIYTNEVSITFSGLSTSEKYYIIFYNKSLSSAPSGSLISADLTIK